ncbi:hypothetical protein [Polyangium mundeleinium]|uniref:6-bladed beta-propeller n=1 Tax=Polyangium mundeleinium TaxID=2995306 RepID=A0ABT5ETH8_9BACT|nr:hypothetical protein [Polyangium mundeleinium]MDC0744637.1 hypothetical protein [Polyangium mundeleinium]
MKHLSFAALCALALSCSRSTPTPEKEATVAPSAAPLAPSASAASAEREPPKKTIPTLVPEPFEGTKGLSVELFGIEGALLVAEGLRVGRIVEERVEWIGSIPENNPGLGPTRISSVHGFWPDGVDVVAMNLGRAPMPTLFPLTGKGVTRTFGPGGILGWINGTTRLGKTTLVVGYDGQDGHRFDTVRGPTLVLKPIEAEKGGCKADEVQKAWGSTAGIALPPSAMAATESGTLVTIGNLCERAKSPAAEVWDQPGKSRIVELGALVKEFGYFPKMFRGKGDDLWVETSPVLHYNGGKFELLPTLDKPIRNLFVSPSGKLHGISGRSIVRYDEGTWSVIAQFPRPMHFSTIVMDEKETIWVSHSGVSRLRETTDAAVEEEGCKTPFVYLYEVSWRNDAKYTFPTTTKALSTFPEVGDLGLVEYYDDGRRLGITVKSKEQGEAVIAHVKANMKDEHPELICYAPRVPRVIEIKAKK